MLAAAGRVEEQQAEVVVIVSIVDDHQGIANQAQDTVVPGQALVPHLGPAGGVIGLDGLVGVARDHPPAGHQQGGIAGI